MPGSHMEKSEARLLLQSIAAHCVIFVAALLMSLVPLAVMVACVTAFVYALVYRLVLDTGLFVALAMISLIVGFVCLAVVIGEVSICRAGFKLYRDTGSLWRALRFVVWERLAAFCRGLRRPRNFWRHLYP